jgi:NitT/TauT family transport system permease protein
MPSKRAYGPISRIRLGSLVTIVLSLATGLIVWEVLVRSFDIPAYVLPDPLAVLRALADGLWDNPLRRTSFWYHLGDTLFATVCGFLIGAVLGVVLAALMAEFRTIERALFPYIAALQSLPKVAIAPLYIIWFGYQIESKIAMAATLALFPILLNSLQGFLTVDRDRLEMVGSLDASRWQTFRYIKLPASLPIIFAGLNLGIVYGLLGTLVAEFIGGQRGMGVLVLQLQSVNDTAGVFAVLVVLAVVGYVLLNVMRAIQRHVVFWSVEASSLDVS